MTDLSDKAEVILGEWAQWQKLLSDPSSEQAAILAYVEEMKAERNTARAGYDAELSRQSVSKRAATVSRDERDLALNRAKKAEDKLASIAYSDHDLSSGMSWSGNIIAGDSKSIHAVRIAVNDAFGFRQAVEVERKRAEAAEATIAALREQVGRLREALKPFCEVGPRYDVFLERTDLGPEIATARAALQAIEPTPAAENGNG